MSFHEISIAVRAENRASYAFRAIAMDVVHLGYSFGLLDSQTGRVISGVMSFVHIMVSLKAILATTTAAQTAQNAATATHTGLLGGSITAIGSKIAALLGLSSATGVATGATWSFNAAQAAKIVLLTMGVGTVVVAAAAMAALAMQTQNAANAMRDYSSAAGEAVGYTRGVSRAGEEESALLRRGVGD